MSTVEKEKTAPFFNQGNSAASDLSARLTRIYARLPEIRCQGKCQQSCGPIGIFPAEVAHLRRRGHALPVVGAPDGLTCSALTSRGRCAIYADRPLICRLWALTKEMRCPWGCRPRRWVSREEARAMMAEVRALLLGETYHSIGSPEMAQALVEMVRREARHA